MNYFELFEVPVSFFPDLAEIRKKYHQLSFKFHPDFHSVGSAYTENEVLEKSTEINEAYQTLLDHDKLLSYILDLYNALPQEGQAKVPQDFLLDMMDINESLMELELDFDPERYKQVLNALEMLEKELLAAIQPVLETYPNSPNPAADLRAVLEFFLKKRYLLRIRENLSKFAPQAGMAEW